MINKYYNLGKNILFPICRSITGNGTKKTLRIIKKNIPKLKILKIKSGTKVFDWRIPSEWNIKDAYILDKDRSKIVDFKKNNLHIVGYSHPVNRILYKKDLLKNLHSLKSLPNAIPYLTSYYKKYWGFCVTEKFKKILKKKYKEKDKFFITIKSKFKKNGSLEYGEFIIKGKSEQEILISTYICHPSMANNELSGIIVSMSLIDYFKKSKKLDKTLRFIFIPETIGSITYLNKNLEYLKKNVIGGFNLSCIGDDRNHSFMSTKYDNTNSDQSILEAYKSLKIKFKKYSFLDRGSDERQYNSPGIDLPIASIFRTKYGEYSEYHTSLDDFKLVTKKGIMGGYTVAKTAIQILAKKIIPKAKILCEPNMSKRKLYPTLSRNHLNQSTKNLMDFLIYADGKNDLKKISKYIKLNYNKTLRIYKFLLKKNLLQK
jgi:aminopeptidase-like protein